MKNTKHVKRGKKAIFLSLLMWLSITGFAFFLITNSSNKGANIFVNRQVNAVAQKDAYGNSLSYSGENNLGMYQNGALISSNDEIPSKTSSDVKAEDIKMGNVVTSGSLAALGPIRSISLQKVNLVQTTNLQLSDIGVYDVSNRRIPYSFDQEETTGWVNHSFMNPSEHAKYIAGTWNALTKKDTFVSKLSQMMGSDTNSFVNYSDSTDHGWYSGGDFSSFASNTSNVFSKNDIAFYDLNNKNELSFKMNFDAPALVDHISVSALDNILSFENVEVETEAHEIFYLKTNLTDNNSIVTGALSSIGKSRGLVEANKIPSYPTASEADAQNHRIVGEWGNDREYFGSSDAKRYEWENFRRTSTTGNLWGTALDNNGSKILSYSAKPGYQALFIKDSSALLQTASDADLVAGKYPTSIPLLSDTDRWNVNYGWIAVNPGDIVHMFLVRNDFDFNGIFTKRGNQKQITITDSEYKNYITRVKLTDKDSSVNSANLTENGQITLPGSGSDIKVISNFDQTKVPTDKLFTGFQLADLQDTSANQVRKAASRFNFNNLNLPKDSNGKYMVGAFIEIKLFKEAPFFKSYDGVGDPVEYLKGLNARYQFLDFNKTLDFPFTITREAIAKITFVPLEGYQFDTPESSQIKKIKASGLDIPWTELGNPLIGFDSFVGDNDVYTTKFSMSNLGEISSAALNFKVGQNLYDIKFWDENNNSIPYRITDFDGNLDSIKGDDQWNTTQLTRLTKIMSTSAKDSFELFEKTEDPNYPVWNTIDGKPANEGNVFMSSYNLKGNVLASRNVTQRYEFSFPIPAKVDHITYAAPSDTLNGKQDAGLSSLEWVKVKNVNGVSYESTQIGYSPDWGYETSRMIQYDAMGNLVQNNSDKSTNSGFVNSSGSTYLDTFIDNASLKNTPLSLNFFLGQNFDFKHSNNNLDAFDIAAPSYQKMVHKNATDQSKTKNAQANFEFTMNFVFDADGKILSAKDELNNDYTITTMDLFGKSTQLISFDTLSHNKTSSNGLSGIYVNADGIGMFTGASNGTGESSVITMVSNVKHSSGNIYPMLYVFEDDAFGVKRIDSSLGNIHDVILQGVFKTWEKKPLSKIYNVTKELYYGNTIINWKVSNPQTQVNSTTENLGLISEGAFSIFSAGLTADKNNIEKGINDLVIYDENGVKIPYRITQMQHIGAVIDNSSNRMSEFTSNVQKFGIYNPIFLNNVDKVSADLQDEDPHTGALYVTNHTPGHILSRFSDEAGGLGRYNPFFEIRWEFADGKSHKIGRIEQNSQFADRNYGQDLSTWGNIISRMGMSFKTETGKLYYVDSVQGTPKVGTMQSMYGNNGVSAVQPYTSVFGQAQIPFHEIQYKLGDHLHLRTINDFVQPALSSGWTPWGRQGVVSSVVDALGRKISISDFVIQDLQRPINISIEALFKNFEFVNNNHRNYIDYAVEVNAHQQQVMIVLPDDIINISNWNVIGANGSAYIDVEALRNSKDIDVVFSRKMQDGTWGSEAINLSPDDLINGDYIKVNIRAAKNGILLDKNNTPITKIERIFRINSLADSSLIKPPLATSISFTGKNTLASLTLDTTIASSSQFTFEIVVESGQIIKRYGLGVIPHNLKNSDKVSVNIVSKPGYLFELPNGSKINKIVNYIPAQVVANLQEPQIIQLPPETTLLTPDKFDFQSTSNSFVQLAIDINDVNNIKNVITKLQTNHSYKTTFKLFDPNSLIPIDEFTTFDFTRKFNVGQKLQIIVEPMPGSVFGVAGSYQNVSQKFVFEVEVSVKATVQSYVATYTGSTFYPTNLVYTGSDGQASIELDQNAWLYTDFSTLLSQRNSENKTFKAFLFRKSDIGKDLGNGIISIPSWTNIDTEFDESRVIPSEVLSIDKTTKQLFQNLANGDVIMIASIKDGNASWINTSQTDTIIPLTNSYAMKYEVSNLPKSFVGGETLSLPTFNTGMLGIDGNVKIVANGEKSPQAPAVSFAQKVDLLAQQNVVTEIFLVSSFVDPKAAISTLLPQKPFSPFMLPDDLSSSTIPSINGMNDGKFMDDIKVGNAPWIQKIDPFNVYPSLPIHSGDYIITLVKTSDNSKLSASDSFYYRVAKVPNLLHKTTGVLVEQNSNQLFDGTNGVASLLKSSIKYDESSTNITVKIDSKSHTDANGQKQFIFDHVPTEREYSFFENDDIITIDADVKPGFWWGNPTSPSDVFASSVHFNRQITVSGLSTQNVLINYKALSISDADFTFGGINQKAVISIAPNSNLFNALLVNGTDYRATLNLYRSGKIIDTTSTLNANFFEMAKNGDEISVTYSAMPPKVWSDAPNAEKIFESNKITLNNKFALNVFTDGNVSRNLINSIWGTEGHVRVVPISVSPAIATIKVNVYDKNNVLRTFNGVTDLKTGQYDFYDIQIGDKIVATMTPNHQALNGLGYWVDYSPANIADPTKDVHTSEKIVEVKKFFPGEDVLSNIKSAFFGDGASKPSFFSTLFTGGQGILGGQGKINFNSTEFEKEANIDAAIKSQIRIVISQSTNKANREKTIIYDSETSTGSYDVLFNILQVDSIDELANFDVLMTVKDNQHYNMNKEGYFAPSISKTINANQSAAPVKDQTKLWNMFNLFKVLSMSDINFVPQTSAMNPLVSRDIEDNVDFVVEFASSEQASNALSIINLLISEGSKLSIRPTKQGQREFEYSSTKKDFVISAVDNTLKITFSKIVENGNLVTLEPNVEYQFVVDGLNPNSKVKLYDNTNRSITSYTVLENVQYESMLASLPIMLVDRFHIVHNSTFGTVILKPNAISGSGAIDNKAMNIDSNTYYNVHVFVKRGNAIIFDNDHVDAATIIDGLTIGDNVVVSLEMKDEYKDSYRFTNFASEIKVVDQTLDSNLLLMVVRPSKAPEYSSLGISGISGFASMNDLSQFSIANVQMDLFVRKNGVSTETKVASFNNLSNGDVIIIRYSFIGGGKFEVNGVMQNEYEIDYPISGLSESLEIPNLRTSAIRFKPEGLILRPVVDWRAIFGSNYDLSKLTATLSVLDQNHNTIVMPDPLNQNANWLTSIPLLDLFQTSSTMNAILAQISVPANGYFNVTLNAQGNYEFENYQGKTLAVEARAVSNKIDKNTIEISSYMFDELIFENSVSGFSKISASTLDIQALNAIEVDVNFVVTDAKGNVQPTVKNAFPVNLANGDTVEVIFTPKDKLLMNLSSNGLIKEEFRKKIVVNGLLIAINKPVFNAQSLSFAKFDQQGRIVITNVGLTGTSVDYEISYEVKRKTEAQFLPVVGLVSDLSNGDEVKAVVKAPSGYAFVENGAVVDKYTSQAYLVDSLLISRYNISLPKNIIISTTNQIKNLDTNALEMDSAINVEYTLGSNQKFTKWSDIPANAFVTGQYLSIKITGAQGKNVVFSGGETELSWTYSIKSDVVYIDNMDEIKMSPFIKNNQTYSFVQNKLPVLPNGISYRFTIQDENGNARQVPVASGIKPGETLILSIEPKLSSVGIILDEKLGDGVFKFKVEKDSNLVVNSNSINLVLPEEMYFSGNDGEGTFDISISQVKRVFETKYVNFTFYVIGLNGVVRTVTSLEDLKLSNGESVMISASAMNGKLFSNGSNELVHSYKVSNLPTKQQKSQIIAISLSLVGLSIGTLSLVSVLKILKAKKIFKEQ